MVLGAVAVLEDTQRRAETHSLANDVIVGSKGVGGPFYRLAQGGAKPEGMPRCSSALPGPFEVGASQREAASFERDPCRIWFALAKADTVSICRDNGNRRGFQPGGLR